MDKMRMTSKTPSEINIDAIGRICPSCIVIGKDQNGNEIRTVDFDILKLFLGEDKEKTGDEFFEFTWPGKRSAIIESNTATGKTLRPCVDKSVNWNTTQNIYIEGDNLEALKILQESYLNAVDVIYIDPPYNTGKDFIYVDKFAMSVQDYTEKYYDNDNESHRMLLSDSYGRFHSYWCSMIFSRMLLAGNLL